MITKLFILTAFCFGAFAALDSILLHFTGKDREQHFDKLNNVLQTVLKPVFGCLYCSPTFWGNVGYFLLCYFGAWQFNLAEWLVLYVSTCGMIWLTVNITKL